MRADLIETFQGTMRECFVSVVDNMLGPRVRQEVLQLVERSGIALRDLASRFDDVVNVLTGAFGTSARVLVYKTVVELYNEYSVRASFSFQDSLRDQIMFLKERVTSDLLRPRHLLSIDSFYVPKTMQH